MDLRKICTWFVRLVYRNFIQCLTCLSIIAIFIYLLIPNYVVDKVIVINRKMESEIGIQKNYLDKDISFAKINKTSVSKDMNNSIK